MDDHEKAADGFTHIGSSNPEFDRTRGVYFITCDCGIMFVDADVSRLYRTHAGHAQGAFVKNLAN